MITRFLSESTVLGLAIRSMLPLIAVLFIAVIFRKTSPARLHFIWFLGLCGCMVLPLTSLALPRWNFELLPSQMPSEMNERTSEYEPTPTLEPQTAAVHSQPLVQSVQVSLALDSSMQIAPLKPSTKRIALPETIRNNLQHIRYSGFQVPSMASLIATVWTLGTFVLSVRLLSQTWSVNRLLRACRTNEDPSWQDLLLGCRSQMQIRSNIRLVFHRHTISPMVFGWIRSVILLPESALLWPTEKRKLVVMHELAHVQRRDLATQMLAGIVCSLYWFNPLAWLASHQMRRLREIACDDLVVSRTAQAGQYAETLLAIAKSCRGHLVAGGIAMSRGSHVGHRIRCILDTARRRNPFSARSALLLACLTVSMSVVCGALGFTTEAQEGVPDVYEFRLQRGYRISGRVVDSSGVPISGAKLGVRVKVSEPIWGSNPSPMISRELDTAVTNDQGIWEVTNAPAPLDSKDYVFSLSATHPDYLSDSREGELQEQQGITTEQLRAGSSSLTLEKGVALTGLITDAQGRPVTNGLVIWNERPYMAIGVNETEIDPTGHYKTIHLAPGKRKITVVASGFAPQQRLVEIRHSTQDVDFQLDKGHPLKIQITDSAGKPLPKAYVQIRDWRGTEALYSQVHPSVLKSGIPDQADENGLFIWDWAPEDAVKYSISAKGYSQNEVTLIAKEEPHQVRLVSPPTNFGNVTDAITKKPIEHFRVVPVKAYSPDFYSTDFQAVSGVKGEHGEYRIQFESYGQKGNRYRVRIEAQGYRTAFGTKDLAVGDSPVQEDFQLEPKAAWVGIVEDLDGQPVTEFKVAVGTPTIASKFRPDRLDNNFGIAIEVKDKNRFELAATFEPCLFRVFNDHGFAEVLRQRDEPIGTIRLQPWASVSGRLMQGDTPTGNEEVYFWPIQRRGLTEARFQDSYYVKTDVDGFFRFDKLPPELGSINAYLGPWRDSKLTSSESLPLQLEAGKTSEILLGGGGVSVHGRVIATGRANDGLNKNWSLNYVIRRDSSLSQSPGLAPLSFDPSEPLSAEWSSRPDFHRWLASQQHHFVKLSPDGRLKIHGVEAGNYDLLIELYEQPAGCLVETVGQKVIPLTITDTQVAQRDLELGDIEIPCRIGPRVGADMRAFKFTDSNGIGKLVDDLQGRYVLFHVWATRFWTANLNIDPFESLF